MISRGKPSKEALRILAEAPQQHTALRREHLPALRAETKAYIAPAVERVLAATGARTETVTISGVECLIVTPRDVTVEWPILYGYGGGFVQGSPFEDLTIAAPLSAMTGAKVILPHYRLAPEHPWPAAIDDGFSVYQTLADAPFALVGESAGGNFALSVLLRAKDHGLPLPGAMGLLSPWCDLTNSSDSQEFNNGRDPTLAKQDSFVAARLYAGGNDLRNPSISPLYGAFDASIPPSIITTGTRDLLLSHAVSLANTLRDSGVVVDLQVWEGLWHVFEWEERLPEAEVSIRRIADFMTRHMSP